MCEAQSALAQTVLLVLLNMSRKETEHGWQFQGCDIAMAILTSPDSKAQ
jgi:hypothetical protein